MRWFGFLVCLLTLALPQSPAHAQGAFSAEQKRELEVLVRDILVKNPKILVEAMQALEQQREDLQAEAARAAIKQHAKLIFDDGASFVAGNPKGDVTLVEFFDYRCGYCKQVQPAVQALLQEDTKLRVVLKELPVLGPESILAARAAIAALEQKGRYLAYHNAMMSFRGRLTEDEIFRIAGESGLNVARLKQDMDAPKVARLIEANLDLAHKLGIEGTPGFVVGDTLVPGAVPLETLRQLIAKKRGG